MKGRPVSDPNPPPLPEVPPEVWLLWNATAGHWTYDADAMAPLDGFIACLSRKGAQAYAEHLKQILGVTAIPVRVK
jgi:hypothetical protein